MQNTKRAERPADLLQISEEATSYAVLLGAGWALCSLMEPNDLAARIVLAVVGGFATARGLYLKFRLFRTKRLSQTSS